ncbi:MAG: PilZ domain-containing protein [Proteobacteria bacterium]|nr:PilZ domain-containing protein [Pseudomonadota bacterium]MBU1640265.1 PilZ domain-containing protein [Pseudomonadota bacterium]
MNIAKERRKHQRFEALDNILAINTSSFGQVINVSMSGLRIKYLLRRNDPFHHAFDIALLNNTGDQYIDKLPCRVVSSIDFTPSIMPQNLFVREVGVMFDDLTSAQINQLADFVLHNTLVYA